MQPQAAVRLKLDFTYENEKHPALRNVEGEIAPGRCVVLCGSSGCGKSTLLRCMNQLIPQFYEGELKGFVSLDGRNPGELSIGETGRLAASVFQDPRSQFFTLNSDTEVAFGLENFGYSQENMETRVDEAFRRFHLEALRGREVFSLSSGQRQQIAIAAAWAMDTEILLLDEPTANLDHAAILGLRGQLEQLKAEGKTLVISEHRLWYLRELADEYWLLDGGEIKMKYRAEEMLALTPEQLKSLGLRTLDLGSLRAECSPAVSKEQPFFRADNVEFSYGKRETPVLKGLNLEAYRGEVIGLVGSNGCGKTSFGKLAAGLYRPQKGKFFLEGREMSSKDLQNQGIFIMQEAEFQFFTNSVLNELCYGQEKTEEKMAQIKALLQSVDLWKCRNRHPFSLSGGQMQKLVLLMACLSPKPLVVLDEPTAGLDYGSLRACADLIRRMQETKTVFLITHDPELMALVCSRCLEIGDGKILREFDLSRDFAALLRALQERPPQTVSPEPPAIRHPDPNVCLLAFLFSMVAAIGTDIPWILMTYASVLLILAAQRRWKPLLSGLALMGAIFLAWGLWPGVVTAFLVSFFPRMLLICFGALLLAGKQQAPETLAALRRLHMPEKLIMILSVTLRFFPVLRKDLTIMGQSIRTRGFFPTLSRKLRAAAGYLEILVVPMVFRVIRIAEALSASAETRGIALPGRRSSYIRLRTGPGDIGMMCLTALLFAAGLII